MKIQNITNIEGFFENVKKCKGNVELLTSEGDRINLKSQLCKYFLIAKVFSDKVIKEVEIIVHEPEDVERLINYMIRG